MMSLTRWICALLSMAMFLHGPASVALAAPAPYADDSSNAPETEDEYHALYENVFVQLFGMPYDKSEWTYPLDTGVKKAGTYSGMNQYGQTFELEAMVVAPVDLISLPGLKASEIAEIQNRNLEFTGVVGLLKGPQTSIPVNGNVISSTDGGSPDHRFVLTNLEDPNSALFNPPALESTEFTIPELIPDDLDTTVDLTPQVFPEYADLLKQVDPTPAHKVVLDSVFTDLFGDAPKAGSYELPFDKAIDQAGVYQGSKGGSGPDADGTSNEYSLYAQSATPVDLTKVKCSDAQSAEALEGAGFKFHMVSGTIESGEGSAHVTGISVSGSDGEGSALTILEQHEEPHQGEGSVCGFGIWIPIPIPYLCTDAACIAACNATYDAAVDAANAAYDGAVTAASAAYATALASAQNDLDLQKALLITALTAGLALCAKSQAAQLLACALLGALAWWTGPAAFLLCLARVAAVYAACYAAAQLIYDAGMQAASAAFNGKVQQAKDAFNTAINTAKAARDAAIAAARAARDACIDGCTSICWFIIWIYIGF